MNIVKRMHCRAKMRYLILSSATLLGVAFCFGGMAAGQVPSAGQGSQRVSAPPPPPSTPRETPPDYTLGPDDQIVVRANDVEEFTAAPIRVDPKGNVNLPLIGRLHIAGLTTDQTESFIKDRLTKYLVDPEVFVYLVELRSQPISVLGAVNQPGVHQLEGHKTLFEVLSLAGGLRQDAGYSVKITRLAKWGKIPLPSGKQDATGQYYIASVNVKSIMDASNPESNIEIKPDDVISVPKGDIVYVIGAVRKPGGFVLGENETLSALQILSLAEGLDQFAGANKARIMRPVSGGSQRTEIPVNLKALMAGKGNDVALRANDILFVPSSGRKAATVRALETALGTAGQIGAGIAIYHP